MKSLWWQGAAYGGALALAGAVALIVSWTAPATGIDNYFYDFFFRIHAPPSWNVESITLDIDERTLNNSGGVGGIRRALANGLERIAPAHPLAVAVDIILPQPGPDDAALERAFRRIPILILSTDLLPDGRWDDVLPRFRTLAAGVGQVHSGLDRYDAINREIPLEKVAGHERLWALALETFRASRHAQIVETPSSLEVGGVLIPMPRSQGGMMRIRYAPPGRGGIAGISVAELEGDPRLARRFAGKVVFAGVNAQTAARDRLLTPYGAYMPGVEINANAFETIAHRLFLTDVSAAFVIVWCIFLVSATGLIFNVFSGALANILAVLLIVLAHTLPFWMFTRGSVFPYMPGVLSVWLAVIVAAAWRNFVTRALLMRAEASRERYQRAMQFVTHEMRTPLTAIQGSSELMTRYALPDEKRKQIAGVIHSESKRLARMIETFLNVERLSAGQMELKTERFSAPALVEQCVIRVRPLADKKNIAIATDSLPETDLTGDRELMEYAIYNLLTNAIKYSPPETRVTVSGGRLRGEVRLWVQDQGIGMDRNEVRRIFERFYRTKKAEQTGEAGFGIGLSIVEQIVNGHGGAIQVDSTPGKGSRFTLILPSPG